MKTNHLFAMALAIVFLLPLHMQAEKKKWKGVKIENFSDYDTDQTRTVEWDLNRKAVFYKAFGTGYYFCPSQNAVYVAPGAVSLSISTTDDFPMGETLTIIFGGNVELSNGTFDWSVLRIQRGHLYLTCENGKNDLTVTLKEQMGGNNNCIYVKGGTCTIAYLNVVAAKTKPGDAIEVKGKVKLKAGGLKTDANGAVYAALGVDCEHSSLINSRLRFDQQSGFYMDGTAQATNVEFAAYKTLKVPFGFKGVSGGMHGTKDENYSKYAYRVVFDGNAVSGKVYWNPIIRTLTLLNVNTAAEMMLNGEFYNGDVIAVVGNNVVGGMDVGDGTIIKGEQNSSGRTGPVLKTSKSGISARGGLRMRDLTVSASGDFWGIQGQGKLELQNVNLSAKANEPSSTYGCIYGFKKIELDGCSIVDSSTSDIVYNLEKKCFTTLEGNSFNLKNRPLLQTITISTSTWNKKITASSSGKNTGNTVISEANAMIDDNGWPFWTGNTKQQTITLPFKLFGQTTYKATTTNKMRYTTTYNSSEEVTGWKLDVDSRLLASGTIYYIPSVPALYMDRVTIKVGKLTGEQNAQRRGSNQAAQAKLENGFFIENFNEKQLVTLIVNGYCTVTTPLDQNDFKAVSEDDTLKVVSTGTKPNCVINNMGNLEILQAGNGTSLILNSNRLAGIAGTGGISIYTNLSISEPVFCIYEAKHVMLNKGTLTLRAQDQGHVVDKVGTPRLGFVDKSLAAGDNDLIFKRSEGRLRNQAGKNIRQLTSYDKGDANKASVSIPVGGTADWSLKESIQEAANRPQVAM